MDVCADLPELRDTGATARYVAENLRPMLDGVDVFTLPDADPTWLKYVMFVDAAQPLAALLLRERPLPPGGLDRLVEQKSLPGEPDALRTVFFQEIAPYLVRMPRNADPALRSLLREVAVFQLIGTLANTSAVALRDNIRVSWDPPVFALKFCGSPLTSPEARNLLALGFALQCDSLAPPKPTPAEQEFKAHVARAFYLRDWLTMRMLLKLPLP